jgi:hypothetical protein
MFRVNTKTKFWRLSAAFLLVLTILPMIYGQRQAKAVDQGLKYKQKITKLGIGHSILVETSGKRVLAGRIAEIKDSEVVIDEVDLKAKVNVAYDDITYVEGNYGGKGITGARVRPHRANILFIATVGAIIAIGVAVAASSD